LGGGSTVDQICCGVRNFVWVLNYAVRFNVFGNRAMSSCLQGRLCSAQVPIQRYSVPYTRRLVSQTLQHSSSGCTCSYTASSNGGQIHGSLARIESKQATGNTEPFPLQPVLELCSACVVPCKVACDHLDGQWKRSR
jgi:hypothetical protein